MKILKSVRKHYCEKALKAHSDYISTKYGKLKDLVERCHANGEGFKINTTLPLLDMVLIENGYTLSRVDNANLIYIRK